MQTRNPIANQKTFLRTSADINVLFLETISPCNIRTLILSLVSISVLLSYPDSFFSFLVIDEQSPDEDECEAVKALYFAQGTLTFLVYASTNAMMKMAMVKAAAMKMAMTMTKMAVVKMAMTKMATITRSTTM
jgi:hypothetical protein